MHTLLRPTFAPEPWAAADLDAAADHWLWLFDRGPAAAGTAAEHWAAVRLRGFPRSDADAVAAALAERLPGWEIRRPDPDTVTAVSPPKPFDAPPPPGLGVPRLAGPPFDGLYAEARLRTVGTTRGKPTVDSTLVLAGELNVGGLTLYTVWREGGAAERRLHQRPVAARSRLAGRPGPAPGRRSGRCGQPEAGEPGVPAAGQ